MTDTKRLRELAEAATPGPWTAYKDAVEDLSGYAISINSEYRDVAFISAANPQAIIALIDELEKTKAQLAAANAVVEFYSKTGSYAIDTRDIQVYEVNPENLNEEDVGKRARQYLEKYKERVMSKRDVEVRIGHVNGDHLWYGAGNGYDAALADTENVEDNYAVAVVSKSNHEAIVAELKAENERLKRVVEKLREQRNAVIKAANQDGLEYGTPKNWDKELDAIEKGEK